MKKHYVVLGFTPEHEGDVNSIPWVDLLAGGVKVTDWQFVTPPMSIEDAMISGMNDCISEHDCKTPEIALQLIIDAAENGDDVPDEIVIYEPFETYDVKSLLVEIEIAAQSYVGKYMPLNTAESTL